VSASRAKTLPFPLKPNPDAVSCKAGMNTKIKANWRNKVDTWLPRTPAAIDIVETQQKTIAMMRDLRDITDAKV
jgi:hypothetical protein